MYLPQFYEVEENSKWWGKGYTEWTAVKKAVPLFSGHLQPKVPANNNYYNLMNKDIMKSQAELAEQYGIDGFCFYHYYFKEGKKILEKPAENLLKWRDINMPFCFCWANETWARTWSNIIGANAWGSKFEKEKEENETGILLEQAYGEEEDWERHIEYLIPFFMDERYICYNGNPIFLIYKPEEISCLYKMKKIWNQKLQKECGKQIYCIGINIRYKLAGLDAILYLGPGGYEMAELTGQDIQSKYRNGVCIRKYEDICNIAKNIFPIKDCQTYFSAVTGYDDTPRRGTNGLCLIKKNDKQFKQHLEEILEKNARLGNEFTFINAWNEWGEGMYLEPDEINGKKYLQMVKDAKCNVLSNDVCEKEEMCCKVIDGYFNKYRLQNIILKKWIKQRGKEGVLEKILKRINAEVISIYGFGDLGQLVYSELFGSGVRVNYIIDENVKKMEVVNLETFVEKAPREEAVIITLVLGYDEIYDYLMNSGFIKVYTINELLDLGYERGYV